VSLETLLLLEREAVAEGRGESLAAWVCTFLLGEAGAVVRQQAPWSPVGWCRCFGTAFFPWGRVLGGCRWWQNRSGEILL